MPGTIRVGVGGWVFEPWRGTFYPRGLPQKRELEYASRKPASIEINGTYYGAQRPESFRRWREETPPDDLDRIAAPERTPPRARDVFVYMINGHKPKAPAAAMALIERLRP